MHGEPNQRQAFLAAVAAGMSIAVAYMAAKQGEWTEGGEGKLEEEAKAEGGFAAEDFTTKAETLPYAKRRKKENDSYNEHMAARNWLKGNFASVVTDIADRYALARNDQLSNCSATSKRRSQKAGVRSLSCSAAPTPIWRLCRPRWA